jgi:hypothetical protein
MTEVERLARDADIPAALARMVVEAAAAAGVSLRSFRTDDRRPHLVAERQRLILVARDRGFSLPQVGRALNRDHSTILTADRRARKLVASGLLALEPPPRAEAPMEVQLDFLPGPLFDFAGLAA